MSDSNEVNTPGATDETMQVAIEIASKAKATQRIAAYLGSEAVLKRFADIMGDRHAAAYVNSVLTVVRGSEALQACSLDSIFLTALRAATLGLSCDPSLGEAYVVPFGARAELVVGYKGLYDMAVRTGKYRYINVAPIYEGVVVEENPISGFHSLTGHRQSNKVIGWLGAFEMVTGYAKTLYMTVEEIHAHAKAKAKAYNSPKSGWNTDTQAMERKTILRLLLRRWGYFDPAVVRQLDEIENPEANPDIYAPAVVDVEAEPGNKRSFEQNMHDLGYE